MNNNNDIKPPSVNMNSRSIKPWIGWVIKVFVGVGLIIFLLRFIDPAEIRESLSSANPSFLLAALLLSPVNIFLQTLRWKTFVKTEKPDITFTRCLTSLLGGFSLGLITPGRVGEIGRVFLLQVPSRLRLAGLHIFDKMYMFGAVSLTGPLLLYLFPGFRAALPDSLRVGAGIFVALLPLLYLFLATDPRPLKSLFLGVQLVFPSKPRALQVIQAVKGLKPKDSTKAFALTMAQLMVIFTQFHLISNAFQPVNWFIAAHTYGAVLFIKSALPVSLGSLGVGEWATVSLYERYGIAKSVGFNSSLLLFAMNILLPALAGLPIIFRARLQTPGVVKDNAEGSKPE